MEEMDPLINKLESVGSWEETRKVSGKDLTMCEAVGIQGSPIEGGQAVAVFAERVPSWLPVVDGWGSEDISLYCEKELEIFRKALRFKGGLTKHQTVVGMKSCKWWEERQKVVVIQGSSGFVKKIVKGLTSIGVTGEDKIIVATNKRNRTLPISFKFLRIDHSLIGGVTNTISHIGVSSGFSLKEEAGQQVNPIHRRLTGLVNVTQKASSCPPHNSSPAIESGQLVSLNDLANATFKVPCIFNIPNSLGYRKLTSQEILTAMDFPKGACDHSSSETFMSSMSGKDLATLVPLKVLQHVSTILATEEVLTLDESPIEEKVQLAPTVPNMNLIYQEISQAKAAKNDDATANTKIWCCSV